MFDKEQPGGHKSLRGREGGHSHGQELKRNFKDKQYQNKTKQNNADEANVMIKIITMFSYDPHQRSQEVKVTATLKKRLVLLII